MILSKSLVLNVNRFLQKVKDNAAFIAVRRAEPYGFENTTGFRLLLKYLRAQTEQNGKNKSIIMTVRGWQRFVDTCCQWETHEQLKVC